MKCFEGGRPGAKVRTSADVRARRHELRAIRRLSVSHLLFLRAGGAETLRQGIAKWCLYGNVEVSRLGSRRGLGQAQEPHGRQRPSWPRSERGANRRGGEKPRGRTKPGRGNPGIMRTRAPMSSKGSETPGGDGSSREAGPGTAKECPERGPSLREPLRTPVRGIPADGTPRGRTPRRGGSREPITRLHRAERAPRGRATL
jgi:hypothetical protein